MVRGESIHKKDSLPQVFSEVGGRAPILCPPRGLGDILRPRGHKSGLPFLRKTGQSCYHSSLIVPQHRAVIKPAAHRAGRIGFPG